MDTPRNRLLYPSLIIAAISVTLFSLVGIATMTGHIPSANASGKDTPEQHRGPSIAGGPGMPAGAGANPGQSTCGSCGVVESVRSYEVKGEGSGLGAVAGGVAGALIGNQIGAGNGRTAMTVLGGAGGAYAGHEIEKNVKKTTNYRITVRMEDGTVRTVTQGTRPAVAVGERVKVQNGAVVPVA